MKKKREREPDLIEFKVNYTLDDDFPVEKYFMAYNSTDALKSFAQSCAKHLSEKTISDIEMSCFTAAFATPNEPYIEKPEIIPLPKPIPELDESELEIIEEVNVEEPLTKLDAFGKAVKAGRMAYLAGMGKVSKKATATSPLTSFLS